MFNRNKRRYLVPLAIPVLAALFLAAYFVLPKLVPSSESDGAGLPLPTQVKTLTKKVQTQVTLPARTIIRKGKKVVIPGRVITRTRSVGVAVPVPIPGPTKTTTRTLPGGTVIRTVVSTTTVPGPTQTVFQTVTSGTTFTVTQTVPTTITSPPPPPVTTTCTVDTGGTTLGCS